MKVINIHSVIRRKRKKYQSVAPEATAEAAHMAVPAIAGAVPRHQEATAEVHQAEVATAGVHPEVTEDKRTTKTLNNHEKDSSNSPDSHYGRHGAGTKCI